MRDSLYRKILEGLEALQWPLDRDRFEECVKDLLREEFPTLVGIKGGKDAGMDGAIADGEGVPYPLIVTTDQSPIRNVTKSLDSYRAQKGHRARSKVVFVTSRELTPTKRRNLENRAVEKGFTLVQIYDRRAVADRLYWNPRWRKQLLHIPGNPPALSAVPRTRRPLLEIEPVGRKEDLEWLRTTKGDRLLFGEPGSGKTFLLMQLVRADRALFLAEDDDWKAVADSYREERPEIIIVDDVHLEPERLDRLRQVREDIGAKFEILATCWVGEKDQVAAAMGGLAGDQIRPLELLTPTEILKVFESTGVRASDEVLGDLVDQASRKPGLAVTLASLWLRGEWQEVLTGEALRRDLIVALRRVLGGEDPTTLLAAFAVGGDRGMTLEAVAEALEVGRVEVHRTARQVAAGGVLAERGEALAVEPAVFRYALLKEVVFSGFLAPFEYLKALELAPSKASSVETLVGAAHREVEVPREMLQRVVRESGSREAWEGLARLHRAGALWVLENYPGPVEEGARASLEHAPEEAIQRLLRRAETAESTRWSSSLHPMSILETWLMESEPSVEEALRRRRLVMEGARSYLTAGGQRSIAFSSLFAALSPHLERTTLTPDGSGLKLWFTHLPGAFFEGLYALWSQVRDLVAELDDEGRLYLTSALRQWVQASSPKRGGENDTERIRRFTRRLLRDVAPLAEGSPGYSGTLRVLGEDVGLALELDEDPEFEVLFPDPIRQPGAYSERQERQRQAAQDLAANWLARGVEPDQGVKRLAFLERESTKVLAADSFPAVEFCRALAGTAAPIPWLSAALSQGLSGMLVIPFLHQVVKEEGWEAQVIRCLDLDDYWRLAVAEVLRLPEPPRGLMSRVMDKVPKDPQVVEDACHSRDVPTPTLRQLLGHPEWQVALAAALGEWLANPEKEVRQEIRAEWRAAILRAKTREYGDELSQHQETWLKTVLCNDSELSLDWLRARLQDPDLPGWIGLNSPLGAAVQALATEQRIELLSDLEQLAKDRHRLGFVGRLLKHLVATPEVYAMLLESDGLERFHLTPLEGLPEEEMWKAFASLALKAGYDPREIAERVFCFEGGTSVDHWAKCQAAFAEMEKTAEGRLLEVARHGLRIARERIERAREEKRRFELTGHP